MPHARARAAAGWAGAVGVGVGVGRGRGRGRGRGEAGRQAGGQRAGMARFCHLIHIITGVSLLYDGGGLIAPVMVCRCGTHGIPRKEGRRSSLTRILLM